MRRQVALKLVLWPRQTSKATPAVVDGKRLYKYAVVGVLVATEALVGCDGNEYVIEADGPSAEGLADLLEAWRKRPPKLRVGEADMILTNLSEL
jgi:hypothetical protein